MSSKPSAKPAVSRPLSPFMLGQYYRFQISSLLSITHRITGVGLAIGTIFIAVWVMSAAAGPAPYGQFAWFAHTPIGLLLLLVSFWAVYEQGYADNDRCGMGRRLRLRQEERRRRRLDRGGRLGGADRHRLGHRLPRARHRLKKGRKP